MIHIGTYNWAKTIATGQFYCPTCLAVSQYRHRSSRPFLTVYFIPVFPIGGSTSFIECSTCKLQHPETIITPEPPTGDFSADLLNAACLTIMSDGVVAEEEIDVAIRVLRSLSNSLYTSDEIIEACHAVRFRYRSIGEFLWRCCIRWQDEEKLRIIQTIFLVASVNGYITKSRLRPLADAGRILGFSKEELEDCVVQAEQLKLA